MSTATVFLDIEKAFDVFADDTCLYATHRKESFVVRKLQHGLSSMET
jgi:hypothetical protein